MRPRQPMGPLTNQSCSASVFPPTADRKHALRNRLATAAGSILVAALSTPALAQCPQQWMSLDNGRNGTVAALAKDGDRLYVGGTFNSGSTHLSLWDGEDWQPVPQGVPNTVTAMILFDDSLIAGGHWRFLAGDPRGSSIARLNGTIWQPLGFGLLSIPTPEMNDMAVYMGDLIVVGSFSTSDSTQLNRIARWDGVTWRALGSGIGTSSVDRAEALAVSGAELFVGGHFTVAGGQPANNVARWNGLIWRSLGNGAANGVDGWGVRDLVFYQGAIVAGGDFQNAGGQPARTVARWDGVQWSPMNAGFSGTDYVSELAASANLLYAAGRITNLDGLTARNVAKWDGTRWRPAGPATAGDPLINAITLIGGDLYVGGSFSAIGAGTPANNIAVLANLCPLGDMNCDGFFSISDIGGFVLAVTDPADYATQYPTCAARNADFNFDGDVTISDIAPFVGALTRP